MRCHHASDGPFNRICNRPYITYTVKATDENLTSENWEVILNLCDKIQDEGEAGYLLLFLNPTPRPDISVPTALAMSSPQSLNASHTAVRMSNYTHFPSQNLSRRTVGSIFTVNWPHAPSLRLSRSSSPIGCASLGFVLGDMYLWHIHSRLPMTRFAREP